MFIFCFKFSGFFFKFFNLLLISPALLQCLYSLYCIDWNRYNQEFIINLDVSSLHLFLVNMQLPSENCAGSHEIWWHTPFGISLYILTPWGEIPKWLRKPASSVQDPVFVLALSVLPIAFFPPFFSNLHHSVFLLISSWNYDKWITMNCSALAPLGLFDHLGCQSFPLDWLDMGPVIGHMGISLQVCFFYSFHFPIFMKKDLSINLLLFWLNLTIIANLYASTQLMHLNFYLWITGFGCFDSSLFPGLI